jgi:hypothetical protein
MKKVSSLVDPHARETKENIVGRKEEDVKVSGLSFCFIKP